MTNRRDVGPYLNAWRPTAREVVAHGIEQLASFAANHEAQESLARLAHAVSFWDEFQRLPAWAGFGGHAHGTPVAGVTEDAKADPTATVPPDDEREPE